MKSPLGPANRDRTKGKKITFLLLLAFFLMPVVCESRTPPAEKVLSYLKGMGNGRYMFGQMATWVHNENPDMDHPRDCLDVVKKLETAYPELAGFVFWSDNGHYNVVGNDNGPELMAHPKIVTLQ